MEGMQDAKRERDGTDQRKRHGGRVTAYSFLSEPSKFRFQDSIVLHLFTDPLTRKNNYRNEDVYHYVDRCSNSGW